MRSFEAGEERAMFPECTTFPVRSQHLRVPQAPRPFGQPPRKNVGCGAWNRSSSRFAATGSSRRGIACTRSRSRTARSSPRPATAGSPASCAPSSKPIQALPLARARADLDERDLAIASASHRATPDQIAAVRALLAKAPADEADLELGLQEGRPPEPVYNNCSGKHAGMLALCRAHGWATEGYRLPGHPVQQACRDAHAEAADVDASELADRARRLRRRHLRAARSSGWRTPTPASSSSRRAAASRDAMRAHPELVGGPDGADFDLMRAAPGWFAKGGAEGLLCAGGPGLARRRAQVDGRRRRARSARRSPSSSAASGSTCRASRRRRSRTPAAKRSARSSRSARDS